MEDPKPDSQKEPIGSPANKQPIGTPANPAVARRQAAKLSSPIMPPPAEGTDPVGHMPDIDELEKMLEGTKMAQPRPETMDRNAFDPANRKPGAKVYDAKAMLDRRRRILSNLGISDLVLPPITKQTVATYRMIPNMKTNPSTGKPFDPQTVNIPGTYLFYDPGESDPSRRATTMRNLTGKPGVEINQNNGKEETVPNASAYIDFHSGIVKVDTVKEFIKYVFLELHPLNGSNRFRNREVTPVFERIDIKVSRTFMLDAAEMDMARDAEDTVLVMDKETVLAFAASANISTLEGGKPRRIDEIKHDLRVYARNSPKGFFALSGNTKAAVRTNVIDLKHLGLIEFNPDKSLWYDFNTEQTIHVVPRGEDPTISLVDMLNEEENQDVYEALLKLLNYWNRDDFQMVPYEAA